jgi:hypothetical protein
MTRTVRLRLLADEYAICKLASDASLPEWADGDGFVSISRTPDELSIVCPADRVPEVSAARGWRCLQFIGPFAFNETGIALAVIRPLSENGIGIFLVSTFDTDYLLVQSRELEAAQAALLSAGHTLLS